MQIAKRARQVTAGSEARTDFKSNKSVTIAVNEIAEGKVTYERTTDGLK
jgi:DNA-directed RNA polymerase subunit omega